MCCIVSQTITKDKRKINWFMNHTFKQSQKLTFENIVVTKTILRSIGAQQNTYLARRGNFTPSSKPDKYLNIDVSQMKYKSSILLYASKISCL